MSIGFCPGLFDWSRTHEMKRRCDSILSASEGMTGAPCASCRRLRQVIRVHIPPYFVAVISDSRFRRERRRHGRQLEFLYWFLHSFLHSPHSDLEAYDRRARRNSSAGRTPSRERSYCTPITTARATASRLNTNS